MRFDSRDRKVRYGAPVATIIVGVLFAAADTHSLGNTVATVLIAVGLIWFIAALGREMGMTERTGRSHAPPSPPPSAPSDRDSGHDLPH
jgi:hypothetical protein